MKVRIFILTRGRVGRQKTLANLPPQLLHCVRIVCPRDEANKHKANHPGVKVIAQPVSVKSLVAKRRWVAEQASKRKVAAIMMDDDLTIRAAKDGKYVNDLDQQLKGWKQLFKALKNGRADVVGFGTKAFSQEYLKMDDPIRYNYHLGFCFGMTPKAMRAVQWDRIPLFEDIDYTLQLFAAGFHNILFYHNVVEQGKGVNPGGLEGERNEELVDKSLKKLIKLHPEVVKEKEASARHSMSRTKIQWKRAAVLGNCRLSDEIPAKTKRS